MRLKQTVVAMSTGIVLLSGVAQAAPTYSVTDLGTLGHPLLSQAYGINTSGQVVGMALTADVFGHAFLNTNGSMTDLGTLNNGLGGSTATSINDSGQVVGFSETAINAAAGGDFRYTPHAFRYSGGTMTDLGTLGGVYSSASAINNSGQVVGESWLAGINNRPYAFLYSGGVMTNLGVLSGAPLLGYSSATDINNSGQVVGFSTSTTATNGTQGFLYSGGVMTAVPGMSRADGINDSGQIVGHSIPFYRSDSNRAFLYSGGQLTDLGTLSGCCYSGGLFWSFTVPNDINNSGQIVGQTAYRLSLATRTVTRGFLYSGGTMVDLNSLVDPLSDWVIIDAQEINEAGHIAAYGCKKTPALLISDVCYGHALLLKPIVATAVIPPTQITVFALGTPVAGVYPTMVVRVDGNVVGTHNVNSTVYTPYTLAVNVPAAATHRVDVTFTNDARVAPQDRNLYVQSLRVGTTNFAPSGAGVTYDRGAGNAAYDGVNVIAGQGTMPWNGALRFTIPSSAF